MPMQSQDTAWAEDDDAATVADVLAPHFTITNDAQPFATVHSHRLPVPEVGETYIVLGRLTLEQAFEARNIHIPDWLQDLDAQVQGRCWQAACSCACDAGAREASTSANPRLHPGHRGW